MEPTNAVDDMAQLMTIRLNRQDAQPWGFRLQGGKDFGTPLVVQKVNGGSLADQAGLNPGDAVIKINNVEVFNLRHKDAQDVVVRSGNNFDLTIQRGGATWRPSVTPTGSIPSPSSHLGNNIPTVTRTSLAHKQPQEVQHIGSGYNNAARPFSGVNGTDGPVKSIVNKQYNTPVGIYSEEAIAETLSAQAEVLAGGVLGVNFKKNEKIYSGANSEVLKMLHEQENDQSEPAESHQQQYQPQSQPKHNITSPTPVSHHQQSSPNLATKHVNAPIDRPKAPNTGGLPAGQNICAECERLIVGVFIRIKDKNLHAECFKCATCGTSLKNQGYFNFNNKLYCDIHARLAAMNNPPKGTEGHFPVPIQTTQKISANTISAALDAHVQHNGSSNHDTRTSVSPSSYSHSRTSSSSSSIGGTTSSSSSSHSAISSLSPNKSSSPEKLSPAHSRQSSESGSCTNVSSYHHHLAGNSRTITPTVSPSPPPPSHQPKITLPTTAIIYNNEITINHKQNENDMNRNNRNELNNGSSMGYGGDGTTDDDDGNGGHTVPTQPQTNTYNKFLKKYTNKMQNDFLDGSITNDHKSSSAIDLNDSECNFVTMTTSLPAPSTNGYSECSDSIYGTIRPQNQQSNEEFQYVTLAGSVIKSVIAPGKGVKTNYKINTGYGGPRPFNTLPMHPPMRGPQSPSTYPPPTTAQSWAQPQPKQPMNPYATLPRAAGQSHEECQQQCYEYDNQEENYQERSVFDVDTEVVDANRPPVGHFNWPPPAEERHSTPTASPLYIPPPGTQHIVPKPVVEKQQQQPQWQSRSAPELTVGKQQVEIESSSDSYTSTCTTTTTTSEEYQRMYQAQVQSQQYDQYGSELDYHMDMEVAAMQQDHSYSSADYYSMQSGRKSAQECIEYLSGPVSTYHLIDLVRAATPKPETPPPKAQRKVEFSDEVQAKQEQKIEVVHEKSTIEEVHERQVVDEQITTEEIESEMDQLRIDRVSNDLKAENRKFTATPEIKIEIPEPKPVPPSKIPNPVPKEWINPMVRALTTAPDKPVDFHWNSDSADTKMFESVHLKEEKTVTFQDHLEEKSVQPEILDESPAKGSFITRVLSTAPTDSIKFADNINDPVPLPEETEPYMPPPIDMKPYLREDFRPKSPLLSALTTAPDRSYTTFGHDVCSQLDGLPTPKEKLTMVDALTVASARCYTPLDPENAAHVCEENKSKKTEYELLMEREDVVEEQQTEQRSETLDVQMNRQLSAFANLKGFNTVSAFQPRRDSLVSNTSNTVPIPPARHNSMVPPVQNLTEHQDSMQQTHQQRNIQTHSSSQQQQQQILHHQQQQSTFQTTSVTSTTSYHGVSQSQCSQSSCKQTTGGHANQRKSQETEQKISFPPPCGPMAKKTLLSGLHKPDNIPQYQRNWTVLPSQRPVRTPEPPELRENVPLAFVDTPHELTPSVAPSPVVMQTMSNAQHESSASYNETQTSESHYQHQQQQLMKQLTQQQQQQQRSSVPIIITENSGPITMAFQSLDHEDHSSAHPRPYTPSLINHPAPIIPFYQTADKLVAEECSAASARLYDPRSPSPLPGRTHSPAPGPPPNPLSAIRAPRLKDRPIQTGSITTGQSYYGAQTAQYQTEQQGNLVSHYQTGYQSGSQMFTDKPEVVQQRQIGDMTMQTRAKESQMSEENRSELKSKTTTQVGNMQIERHRKVIEEFEHSQTAKSVEILKTHGESREIGKTGFVANQARRLSGLEQEISAITSQSQAISARAAASLADYESTFPHYKSPEPTSTFPIKIALPSHDEPQRPTYIISQNATNKVVSRPPGFNAGPAAASMATSASNYATLSSSYDQSTNKAAAQSSIMASSISSSSCSAATSAAATASSNLTAAIPVPAFKPSVAFGGLPAMSTNSEAPLSNQPQFLTNNQPTNNAYKPTPSTGPAGFKAPPPPPSNIIPNVVNDPSPASAGPNKGGVFGATSAPKRGRGIMNKAVGPGVRVPLCGCCNSQIRGPFITALGRIWCPDHFVCVNGNCRRALQDIGFVEEKGDLYCEYCFEKFLAPTCSKCNSKIKGDCLNAIGKHFHPECFTCTYCGKLFGNNPFFLEEGEAYCEADWNELFTTKCFACGFPVEAGDRWVEALNHNYHSQCFNCTMCKKNLEGQSFYNKGGRPFCKNHAR